MLQIMILNQVLQFFCVRKKNAFSLLFRIIHFHFVLPPNKMEEKSGVLGEMQQISPCLYTLASTCGSDHLCAAFYLLSPGAVVGTSTGVQNMLLLCTENFLGRSCIVTHSLL